MSNSAGRGFYEVLGVPPHALKQEIKVAYRKLALQYHPDKNQGNPSAKMIFQEIQAAYEALSEDNKRAQYDLTAGVVARNPSTRAWREPFYGPCYPYTRDPPFWSAELREMTVQKCARIAKIQYLEREIRELVVTLDGLVAAEDRAIHKEKRTPSWLFSIPSPRGKSHARRHLDFLNRSSRVNNDLNRAKNELRTAHEDHKKLLDEDNHRKTWWAKEKVRRVEEENRKAATMAAEAARQRAEKARRNGNEDAEAARAAEEVRRHARDEAIDAARAVKVEEETRKRAERAREDPEAARKADKEAREWLARQREDGSEPQRKWEKASVKKNLFCWGARLG